MKKTPIIVTIVVIALALIGAFNLGEKFGYDKAIEEAEPFILEDSQLIKFGADIHDYGKPLFVTIE